MYTHGSNALKSEYYTSDARIERVGTGKKRRKVSENKNLRIKKRVVALMFVAFLMSFTVLLRYAAITEEYNKLTTAREELELISAKVVETKVRAEGDMDPKRIEHEAERLGLRPPLKNQVEYISLGNTDNGEVLKAEEPSAFAAFINRVSVILEYLY